MDCRSIESQQYIWIEKFSSLTENTTCLDYLNHCNSVLLDYGVVNEPDPDHNRLSDLNSIKVTNLIQITMYIRIQWGNDVPLNDVTISFPIRNDVMLVNLCTDLKRLLNVGIPITTRNPCLLSFVDIIRN